MGVASDETFSREPMDVAIYDAIDRNLLRIARGIDWTRSLLPDDDWPGVEALRASCLEAGMGAADDALRLYKLYFETELTAALASGRGVIEALETGYAALREGPARGLRLGGRLPAGRPPQI